MRVFEISGETRARVCMALSNMCVICQTILICLSWFSSRITVYKMDMTCDFLFFIFNMFFGDKFIRLVLHTNSINGVHAVIKYNYVFLKI